MSKPNQKRRGIRQFTKKLQVAKVAESQDTVVFLHYFDPEDLKELKEIEEELTKKDIEEHENNRNLVKEQLQSFLSWLQK